MNQERLYLRFLPLARRNLRDVFVGADLSYQARFPRGLNPTTQRAEDPAVVQLAPMLVYSPMGPGAYDRPQLRLVYRASHLNDAARVPHRKCSAEDDRVFLKLGCLTRLDPSCGTLHPCDAKPSFAVVDAAHELVDKLRLVTGGRDTSRAR